MEIILRRIALRETYTIGRLYVNDVYVCDTLEDCVRDLNRNGQFDNGEKKVYGETAITFGRYEVELNVKSPKYSNFAKYPWAKPYDGCLPRLKNVNGFEGILIHCLTPDTEILTEYGWQNLEQFKQNTPKRCYSYNVKNKQIELTDINGFVNRPYQGDLYYCDGKRVCYEVTDEHRMYFGARKHDGSFDWRFDTAKNMVTTPYFLTSACKNGWDLNESQLNLYRLVMATQADGYILNWSKTASQVRFHFTKERKIQRIKYLIEQLNGTYIEFVDKENKTNITLDRDLSEAITEILNPYRYVTNYKELPIDFVNLKSEDMKTLVYEYLFWDGRWENYMLGKSSIITSTNEHTIDILQTMCCLSGLRTNKHLEKAKGNYKSNLWNLSIFENQDIITPSKGTMGKKYYNGNVWCLQNENTTLIIRKNGRTMIIGNCGNTPRDTLGCILVGYNTIKGQLTDSRKAFALLMDKYLTPARKRSEKVFITIK